MSAQPAKQGVWLAGFSVLLVTATYVLGMASWDWMQLTQQARAVDGMRSLPRIDYLVWDRAVEAGFGLWFFALGASVGSFLNVVAYRMPIGISLAKSGSRCPRCRTPIRAQDNIPVFGWLALGGACRACHLPISKRYPIIEAFTGFAFLVFFFARLVLGNQWLPEVSEFDDASVAHVLLDGRWDVLALWLLHVIGFSLLWAATLMAFDDHAPPVRFWITALLGLFMVGAALPRLVPELIGEQAARWRFPPIHIYPIPPWPESNVCCPLLEAVGAMLLGSAAALVIGLVAFCFSRLLPKSVAKCDALSALPGDPTVQAASAIDEPHSADALSQHPPDLATFLNEGPSAFEDARKETHSGRDAVEHGAENSLPIEALSGSTGSDDLTASEPSQGEPSESESPLEQPLAADASTHLTAMLIDQPEPIVVGSASDSLMAWLGIPMLVGMTWGWQTLLITSALALVIVLMRLTLRPNRSQAIRAWGIGYCSSILIVIPVWSWWLKPLLF